MQLDSFKQWMDKLLRQFGKKMDSKSQLDWYEDLRHIPDEDWKRICYQWWRTQRVMPTPEDLDKPFVDNKPDEQLQKRKRWEEEIPSKEARENRAKFMSLVSNIGK